MIVEKPFGKNGFLAQQGVKLLCFFLFATENRQQMVKTKMVLLSNTPRRLIFTGNAST